MFLQNARHLCPALALIAINCYRHPARLFVDGESLLSREGTTQGDPIAMPLYALATLPLLRAFKTEGPLQVWYAENAGAGGKIEAFRRWWNGINEKDSLFGYHQNSAKSILLVKPEFEADAVLMFEGSGVQVCTA